MAPLVVDAAALATALKRAATVERADAEVVLKYSENLPRCQQSHSQHSTAQHNSGLLGGRSRRRSSRSLVGEGHRVGKTLE